MDRIRESGLWTRIKLLMLKEYLYAFVKATKRAGGSYYIDAFAGSGTHKLRQTTKLFDGSVRIALTVDPPFKKCFFIELDKKKYNGLMELKEEFHDRAETIEVMLGDCNENIGEVLDQIPRHAPCFAFLDPEGTELSWETIEKLSTHKKGYKYKIELFVLFPYDMGLVRLLNHDVKEFWQTNYPLLLNKIYGNSKWVEIYEKRATGLLSADDARDKFLRLYMSQIDQLGYAHVIEKLIERDDGHPLYFMIFATDIEVGDRVMRHIFGRDRDTQMSFGFPYASRRNHVED